MSKHAELNSKVVYRSHVCTVKGRTFEASPRYDLMGPCGQTYKDVNSEEIEGL